MYTIKSGLEPPFYYIVKLDMDWTGKIKEFEFSDTNPILARQGAMEFYTLNLRNLSTQNDAPLSIEEESSDRSKYIRKIFSDLPSIHHGSMYSHFGIYLKMNETYCDAQSENTFKESILIHGFYNLKELNSKQVLQSLKQEYQLYLNYDFDHQDFMIKVDFSQYSSIDNNQPDVHKILKIPFELKKPEVVHRALALFEERKTEDWERQIEEGDLLHNAFENTWNVQQFKLQITSFLNTNGGYLFYGIDRNVMKASFNAEFEIHQLKTICLSLLNREFENVLDKIKYDFIIFKKRELFVFQVEPFYKTPVFLKEKYKRFYCRDQHGLKMLFNTDQIAKWMQKRKSAIFEHVKTFL